MSQLSEVQEQSASEEWYVCNQKKKKKDDIKSN